MDEYGNPVKLTQEELDEILPSWESNALLLLGGYIVGILFGILGGFIAWKKGGECVIIITSIIGSILFVRGLSLMVEGYPDEKLLATMA